MQGVRDQVRAGRQLRLRKLLRPAGGHLRLLSGLDPVEVKRRIQAGSQGIWRYADFLPFKGRASDPLEPGLTPLLRADRLAERLGIDAEVWIKNDAANPTHSFKDRVVAVAVAKAKSSASRPSPAPRPATWPTPSPPTPPRPAWSPTSSSPPTWRSRSCSRPASTGPTWSASTATTTTSTGSARSWPRRAPGPSSTSTCAPTTPRARRRSPTRPSSSSAGSCPTGSSARSPPARCSPSSAAASRSGSTSASSSGEQPIFNGAQAEGCSPVATAFAEGWDVCKPQKPETIAKSLAIGDPADGPYAVEHARRTGGGDRLGHRPGDPRGDQAAGRDDRDLHRDRRRRHRRRPAQAGRTRRDRRRRAGRRLHHRRGPEDPRRDPRYVPDARDRPRPRQLRGRVPPGGNRLMSVTVKIPTQLRAATGGEAELEVEGGTVGEVLDAVFDSHEATCATGSPRTATCAASSTSTSPARTSASSRGWRPRSTTAPRSRSSPRSPAVDALRASRPAGKL